MSYLSRLLPAALVLLLAGSSPRAEEQQPQRMPTRDVDITYDVTRPQQPEIYERVRWLVNQHLERVDSPDGWTSIFDRNGNEITLLNGTSHTFRKLEGGSRQRIEPEQGTPLKRDGEFVVAGLRCIDWSWTEDIETHTACITSDSDGVLLCLVVDGKTMIEARSVNYRQQPPELFEVPSNYAPAFAPEGSPD
jgi:hypothetical protein